MLNGYQWLYKSWVVAFDMVVHGRGAMASIALPHVSTENDRQINLSQRVVRGRHLRLSRASRGFRDTERVDEFLAASETDRTTVLSGCTIADSMWRKGA